MALVQYPVLDEQRTPKLVIHDWEDDPSATILADDDDFLGAGGYREIAGARRAGNVNTGLYVSYG